jgi:hypothetical protein
VLQAPQFGSWSQAQGNKPAAAGANGAAKSAAQQSEIDLDFQMLASYLMDEPIAQGMQCIRISCLELQLPVSADLTCAAPCFVRGVLSSLNSSTREHLRRALRPWWAATTDAPPSHYAGRHTALIAAAAAAAA